MDETQKLAMTNLCKEIKHNIETTNPQDKASIAKLEEIKNKSNNYNQFLNNIVDDLDPTYHANINLKPLETPVQNDQKNKPKPQDWPKLFEPGSNNKSNELFQQSPPPDINDPNYAQRPKIVPAQQPPSEFANKKIIPKLGVQMTPFVKQPEINFGSKNSSFNKTIQPGTPVPMGSFIKPPPNYSKLNNNDMPPPQNVQKLSKESKILEKIGINENEERQLIENNTTKKLSYNPSNQNLSSLMNSEKNILNENIVKSKFEKKMNEYSLKNVNQGCLEMLNIGFNTFIKNLLNNLEKVAAIEKNSESLNGFLKNTENIPQPMKIIENQDFKTILLNKRFKPEQFANVNFSLLLAPNKTQALKQYEIYDKDQQTVLEEKIRTRKLFEAYEEKPLKKIKKQADESKDIYDILLKNKNEKAKEFDNQRKNAEDTSRTIDIFLGKSNSSKMSNETKEAQQKQANKETLKQSDTKKSLIEKLRITLKTFIYVLEHDPTYRKMPILLKAYMKQN